VTFDEFVEQYVADVVAGSNGKLTREGILAHLAGRLAVKASEAYEAAAGERVGGAA